MNNIISIVTPSYNQGVFIEETICSILSQEGNFYIDYIVIDGKSSDESVEIIKKYEQLMKDNCQVKKIEGRSYYLSKNNDFEFNKCLGISYRWISEKDGGHGDALNKGFSRAFGNIMAWLNSDDKYYKDAFKKVSDIFNKFSDVEWIVGKTVIYDEGGNVIREYTRLKNFYDFIFGDYGWIQQESTFWRKSLWLKTGAMINNDVKYMVDGELWCRFFKLAKLYHIDQKLSGYRSHSLNRAKLYYEEILGEMDQLVEQLKKGFPSVTYSIISIDCDNWTCKEFPYKNHIIQGVTKQVTEQITEQLTNQFTQQIKYSKDYKIGSFILFIPRVIKKCLKLLTRGRSNSH